MWLMTTDGFYSVIQWHDGGMALRAREKEALERLRERHEGLSEIEVSPGRDYRYRCFCSRETWVVVAADLAARIDYGNFKSAVAKRRGRGLYEKLLHDVWTVMGRLQPGGPYGYHGRYGYPAIPEAEKGLKGQRRPTAYCQGTTKKGKLCNTKLAAPGYCKAHVSQAPKQTKLSITRGDVEIEALPLHDGDNGGKLRELTWPRLLARDTDTVVCDACGVEAEKSVMTNFMDDSWECSNIDACLTRLNGYEVNLR
jgi:hypothetical protein